MDFARQKGSGAFGTRLRRLSERLDKDVAKLYADHGSHFEPRWYPVVALLQEHEPMGVTEIATALGLTHPAVSQVVKQLLDHGLVAASPDPNDERRRLLTLTKKAHGLIEELDPLWAAIIGATDELIKKEVPGLLILLTELDVALDKSSLGDRVQERLVLDNKKED